MADYEPLWKAEWPFRDQIIHTKGKYVLAEDVAKVLNTFENKDGWDVFNNLAQKLELTETKRKERRARVKKDQERRWSFLLDH